MNNLVEIKKLVGGVEVANLTEIAKMAGVKPSTILTWISRNTNFPKPLAEVKGSGRNGVSRLFPIDEVMTWVKEYGKAQRKTNEWTTILSKLSHISKTSPATYKIILEMIDEASGRK